MLMNRAHAPVVSTRKQRGAMYVRATNEYRPAFPKQEAPPQRKLFNDEPEAPAPVPATVTPVTASSTSGITIEYQRQRAKEMNKYFKELNMSKTVEEASTFGWTLSNEIGNGRWVMFGLLVGMLTESATGVDFPDQLRLMVSYLGIADLE